MTIALDGGGNVLARRTYRSSGSGPTWTCHYFATKDAGGSTPELVIDILGGPITPELDQPIALRCASEGVDVYEQIFVFDPALPFGVIAAAADAALLAREQLPIPDPDIATSPPPDRPQLVGVATWLRVGDAWQTFSASATLAGVTATVTATPTEVVWDPGDGAATITCSGPGRSFDPDDSGATSDCAHTYLRHTPGGSTVGLTATITYDVAWTATDGSADTLDPVTRTATVPLTIDQAQAIVR